MNKEKKLMNDNSTPDSFKDALANTARTKKQIKLNKKLEREEAINRLSPILDELFSKAMTELANILVDKIKEDAKAKAESGDFKAKRRGNIIKGLVSIYSLKKSGFRTYFSILRPQDVDLSHCPRKHEDIMFEYTGSTIEILSFKKPKLFFNFLKDEIDSLASKDGFKVDTYFTNFRETEDRPESQDIFVRYTIVF